MFVIARPQGKMTWYFRQPIDAAYVRARWTLKVDDARKFDDKAAALQAIEDAGGTKIYEVRNVENTEPN
jgi:hypothetical protein